MKKIFCALAILLVGFTTTSCRKTKYKKIKLVEVARSIFYAPQYPAITKGYFKEEGLENIYARHVVISRIIWIIISLLISLK